MLSEWLFEIRNTSDPVIVPLRNLSSGMQIAAIIHALRRGSRKELQISAASLDGLPDDVSVLLKVQSVFDVERFLSEVQQYFAQEGSLRIVISTHAAEKLLEKGIIDDYRLNPSDRFFGGKPASEASLIGFLDDVKVLVATQTANQYAIYSENRVQLYAHG